MADESLSKTFTSLQNVPILEADNWADWQQKAGDWIILSGYDDILDGIDEPELVPGQISTERKKWDVRERRACTGLRTRLNDNARALVEKETSLEKLLDILKRNYKKQGTGILIDLIDKLYTIRL
jgi:hypothetical protein